MTQNIYDEHDFFAGYARLPRSISGLDAAPEWPSLRAQLPAKLGRVVDLGCGYGWFSRWARSNGATSVLGLDVSEKMLTRARTTTNDPAIAYHQTDLETLALPTEIFDLAYSSLALHYIAHFDRLVATVSQALVPGGAFVFSVEHPLYTAPAIADWLTHPAGHKVWPLDGYLDEGTRSRSWIAAEVIKQHRTLATYLNTLIRHGLIVSHVEEWGPSPSDIAAHPEWAIDHQRPSFLLISARREKK